MTQSALAEALDVVAGPNTTGRLRNGDTDGLYYVRAQIYHGNDWRGPFLTLALADAAAVQILTDTYNGLRLFNPIQWVEFGKRYWRSLVSDPTTHLGIWTLLPEGAYTSVDDQPSDEDGDLAPAPPLSGIQFGIISTASEWQQGRSGRGKLITFQNGVYCQGGQLIRNGGYVMQADIKALGMFWRGALLSYTPLSGVPTVVGPTQRQSQNFLDRQFFPGAANHINVFVPRPVTNLVDDDGVTDGTFLAGYRIKPTSIYRLTQQVTQATAKSQPITNDYAPPTVGDISQVTFTPSGGLGFFQYDRIESVLLATYPKTNATQVGPGFTGPDVCGGLGAFPDPPILPNSITSMTRLCRTAYSIQAVIVTRQVGVVTYTYGDPMLEEVAYIPVTIEPIPVQSQFVVKPPLDLGSAGVFPGRELWFKGTGTLYQNKDNDPRQQHLFLDAFPVGSAGPIDYEWEDVPGASGYTCVEYWGWPSVKKTFFYIGVKQTPISLASSLVWGNYFSAAELRLAGFGVPDGLYSGGFNGAFAQASVYAHIPAFVNGGSCAYDIPNGNGSYDDYGTSCCGGDLEGLVAYKVTPVPDPNPNSQFSAIPTEPPPLWVKKDTYDYYPDFVVPIGLDPNPPGGFLYNWNTCPIWKAMAGAHVPNYDTSGVAFGADLLSGETAYWRLGYQGGGPFVPGYGIWGYDVSTTGADNTIVYTLPIYIPGPKTYFTDVSVTISKDNSVAVPSLKLTHLLLLNPDTPIGTATVNYVDLTDPNSSVASATVTLYDRPQKYIPGFQT